MTQSLTKPDLKARAETVHRRIRELQGEMEELQSEAIHLMFEIEGPPDFSDPEATYIDATDTEKGHGVYNRTGNFIEYFARIPLPWGEEYKLTFRQHEYRQVSGKGHWPAKPFKVGDLIDGRAPIESGGWVGCSHRIIEISPENELTLEPLPIKKPNEVTVDSGGCSLFS
jgi:hypothetical protein